MNVSTMGTFLYNLYLKSNIRYKNCLFNDSCFLQHILAQIEHKIYKSLIFLLQKCHALVITLSDDRCNRVYYIIYYVLTSQYDILSLKKTGRKLIDLF